MKLFAAIIIILFFLLIVGTRTVFRVLKEYWLKAKLLADEHMDVPNILNVEFEHRNHHLELFLQYQKHHQIYLPAYTTKDSEYTKLGEKYGVSARSMQICGFKHLCFIVGAISRLSLMQSQDSAGGIRAEKWKVAALTWATHLFNFDNDTTEYFLNRLRYDEELTQATDRGWQAMHIYILFLDGQISEEDFEKSCGELYDVVYGVAK